MFSSIYNKFNSLSFRSRFLLSFFIVLGITFIVGGYLVYDAAVDFKVAIANVYLSDSENLEIKEIYKTTSIKLAVLAAIVFIITLILSSISSKFFNSQFERIKNLLASYSEGNYHIRELVSTDDESSDIIQNLHNLAETLEDKQRSIGQLQSKVYNLFNHAPSMFCILDLDGNIKNINIAFKEHLNITKEEAIGHNFLDFIENPNDSVFKNGFIDYLMDESKEHFVEIKVFSSKTPAFDVRMNWNFISDNPDKEFTKHALYGDQVVFGFRVNLFDLTAQKKYEAQKAVLFETMTIVPRLLGTSIAAEELLEYILEQMGKAIEFDLSAVLLSPSEGVDQLIVSAVYNKNGIGDELEGKEFSISRTNLKLVVDTQLKTTTSGLFFEDTFDKELQKNPLTLLLPLIILGDVVGVMIVERCDTTEFTKEEKVIAEAFSSLAAGSIQSVLLRQELQARNIEINQTIKELEKKDQIIQRELDMAVSIQQGILPESSYDWNGLNLVSHYEAMGKVGGDFFDFFHLPQGDLAVFIADVSGHGIPAALVTTMAKVSFTTAAQQFNSPTKILELVNQDLCSNIKTDDYLTVFLITIDKNYNITYVNAGHQPALHYSKKNKTLQRLDSPGYFVGMMGEMGLSYQESKLKLDFGDRIMLFTDGIVEAVNKNREEFGIEYLENLFVDNYQLSVKELENKIINEIQIFTNGVDQKDDLSLIILELDEEYEKIVQFINEGRKNFKLGNYQESIFFFKKALQNDPDNLDIILLTAEAHFRAHQFDASVKYFEDYINIKDNNPYVYYHLALCYFKLKEFNKSIQSNQNALEIDKQFIKSLHLIGLTHKKLGNYDEARKYFAELLEVEPDNQKAIKEMIYLDSLS